METVSNGLYSSVSKHYLLNWFFSILTCSHQTKKFRTTKYTFICYDIPGDKKYKLKNIKNNLKILKVYNNKNKTKKEQKYNDLKQKCKQIFIYSVLNRYTLSKRFQNLQADYFA